MYSEKIVSILLILILLPFFLHFLIWLEKKLLGSEKIQIALGSSKASEVNRKKPNYIALIGLGTFTILLFSYIFLCDETCKSAFDLWLKG